MKLKEYEFRILMLVCIKFELDFNTELPNNSFYKMIALGICREYNLDYNLLKEGIIEL